MITQEDFTRISNDGNGNPRYVCHYTEFTPDSDNSTSWDSLQGRYARALAVASKLGGRKFHNKQYGGGIVFQCYNLRRLCDRINETMAELNGKSRNPARKPGRKAASRYEVIVGNVGSVYSGKSASDASMTWIAYVDQSNSGRGRAAGESVTLLRDGEIVKEHDGIVENPRRNPARRTKPLSKMRNPARRGPTGPRGTVSADDVRELVLFIENDAGLYRQQYMPIVENLRKKKAKGKYDHELAVKLVCYLTDAGAKKYGREIAGDRTFTFNVPTRTAAAREILDGIEAEYL